MPDNKNLQCSFCGKDRDNVDKLIAGPNVYICNECIIISHDIVISSAESDESTLSFEDIPSPEDIKLFLDSHIIAHSETKELLSVSAYNHYKRILEQTLSLIHI